VKRGNHRHPERHSTSEKNKRDSTNNLGMNRKEKGWVSNVISLSVYADSSRHNSQLQDSIEKGEAALSATSSRWYAKQGEPYRLERGKKSENGGHKREEGLIWVFSETLTIVRGLSGSRSFEVREPKRKVRREGKALPEKGRAGKNQGARIHL